jgi:hypothetical protein
MLKARQSVIHPLRCDAARYPSRTRRIVSQAAYADHSAPSGADTHVALDDAEGVTMDDSAHHNLRRMVAAGFPRRPEVCPGDIVLDRVGGDLRPFAFFSGRFQFERHGLIMPAPDSAIIAISISMIDIISSLAILWPVISASIGPLALRSSRERLAIAFDYGGSAQNCNGGLKGRVTNSKSLLIFRNRVNPANQKYSAFVLPQISPITPLVSRQMRALAIVTNAR